MKKLFYLFAFSIIIFSGCAKKGYVDIKNVGFYVNNCTTPFEVQFYLNVAYQPSEISYKWDFGDGTTSVEKEPVHLFQNTGKYTVVLTVVNYKTTITKSMVVDVSQSPMPIISDFEYVSIHGNDRVPVEVKFYNYSQYATNFFWNFGDGKGSTEVEPTHLYEQAGTYDVYLHAICNGDTASSLFRLEILPEPAKISIDVVSIWLPEEYHNGVFELEYYYDIHNETDINAPALTAVEFPLQWFLSDELFFFDGVYDNTSLYFEIWDVYNNSIPIYTFGTKMINLKQSFYPDTLYFGNGGFDAEVLVSYYD